LYLPTSINLYVFKITTELKTKAIVESGTMDAVFTLDSGGKIILQVQFLLNDDDRKRIQEMVRWLLLGCLVKTPGANFLIISII